MEPLKLVRFIFFSFVVATGGHILYATASHPALVVAITAAAALGPYIRHWPVSAAITWAGICGMGLLITGESGFLELGFIGAPAILIVGSIIRLLIPKRT